MEAYIAWATKEVTRNKCFAVVCHVDGGDLLGKSRFSLGLLSRLLEICALTVVIIIESL